MKEMYKETTLLSFPKLSKTFTPFTQMLYEFQMFKRVGKTN